MSGLLNRAAELGWLTAAQRHDFPDAEVAVAAGALEPSDVDILEALEGVREVAPGYRVTGLIGRGGMGVVYRAEQVALGREVALKTVSLDGADGESVQRFDREARALAKLTHPNIVAAYDFGRHAGRLFLAMELVEGCDLRQAVEGGPLAESAVWRIVRQVASALEFAAGRGIVHRDVKPANVLLPGWGRDDAAGSGAGVLAKVADFGLAAFADAAGERLTSRNVTVGSPAYMAPELLDGFPASSSTDLYSLGATAYHALAAESPFSGLSLAGVVGKKAKGDVPRLKGVGDATAELVAMMMAPRPGRRPKDYAELTARIDALLGGDVLRAGTGRVSLGRSEDATLVMDRRPLRRGKGVFAATLVGAAAVATWAVWQRPTAADVPLRAAERTLLFDGQTLGEWRVDGEGYVDKSPDGVAALVLNRGRIERRLPAVLGPDPWYRVSADVDVPEGKTVRFEFDPTGGLAVELEGRDWRIAGGGARGEGVKTMHAVAAEFAPGGWRVLVDGEVRERIPAEWRPGRVAFAIAGPGEAPAYVLEPAVTRLVPASEPR